MDSSALKAFLSDDQIRQDQDSLVEYGRDWIKHLPAKPSLVLFPKTTEQVQQIVLWANKNKISLVPSGGRTGLSGGATATKGEVIVSFEKMNRILEFDAFDQSVRVQAGVITEELQNFALEKGLLYPVDFAARGSSQIGGNIATNAGGIKVIRYGLTRNWVLALKVVTGAGDILELNQSLIKNATGYDLRQLFIGSEGTLGFITEATLGLTTAAKLPQVCLLALADLGQVMNVYQEFKKRTSVLAFEMFTQEALDLVCEHAELKSPLSSQSPYYLVVETEASETLMELFEHLFESNMVVDGAMAQSPTQAKEFWRLREDISESTAPHKPYKNDISVRISKVPEFLTQTQALIKKEYPDFKVIWFGHIGDGNLHINILKPESLSGDEFLNRCEKVNDLLFGLIQRFHGSISAEHGVGLTKKPYLKFTRSPKEIEIMQKIKKIFDPNGIVNPGKIFDL